jgi:anion-transporting  ArsA/GET3 family ATPase
MTQTMAGTARAASRAPSLDMDRILKDPQTRVIVCCGAGGVGKTTTAAALALRAAEQGRTVVVLTIDPARRLAQALGVSDLDNTPQEVKLNHENTSGGRLFAMMLDMRRTFDEIVLQHSTPERAKSVLANPFYQTIASSFSGTQEYMAMEKLGQLVQTQKWDLVVVDTPPSRNALDFLDAPQRLGNFLDGRLIKLFLAPGRGFGKFVTGALSVAMKSVSTVVGSSLLADASAFVQSLDSMFGGFRERANRTYELLRKPGTQFVVVSAAEPDALREAAFFVDRLSSENMPLAGLILNRTHPTFAELSADRALSTAEELERVADNDPDAQLAAAVLRVHADRAVIYQREQRLFSRFAHAHPQVAMAPVPSLPFEVSDLVALRAVGEQLASRA